MVCKLWPTQWKPKTSNDASADELDNVTSSSMQCHEDSNEALAWKQCAPTPVTIEGQQAHMMMMCDGQQLTICQLRSLHTVDAVSHTLVISTEQHFRYCFASIYHWNDQSFIDWCWSETTIVAKLSQHGGALWIVLQVCDRLRNQCQCKHRSQEKILLTQCAIYIVG